MPGPFHVGSVYYVDGTYSGFRIQSSYGQVETDQERGGVGQFLGFVFCQAMTRKAGNGHLKRGAREEDTESNNIIKHFHFSQH